MAVVDIMDPEEVGYNGSEDKAREFHFWLNRRASDVTRAKNTLEDFRRARGRAERGGDTRYNSMSDSCRVVEEVMLATLDNARRVLDTWLRFEIENDVSYPED